jgi:catalase
LAGKQARQLDDTNATVASLPFNANKAAEYGREHATVPLQGQHAAPPSDLVGASSLAEANSSGKTGRPAAAGDDLTVGPLDRLRVDATGQPLSTNQGVLVADNQHSLKAGLRGPALLKDFILREKITHFDHERIPERVVHARGSAAHGYFECYEPLTKLTRAAPFQSAGKITPVFVRFSTVAGERGSKDTARDVRGFAVKFYTDEGNWDLVGNNMPVFFIQDAMKFPDLVHAVKPEPHHGMPQAASAHDTFWDFIGLMPESIHTVMWVMSDRAIPRSLRMMQGFGVHTFRLVNDAGASVFAKFHWNPVLGTHSLWWDEAVKISGADPDYHRRDLWEAIESGEYPAWELGLQVFTEEQAARFSFDVLDPTKLVPEELVPVTPVGRMVLNRNPDNFFAETEQVAFCTAHVVPGIDFTNDPLLAGRIHSYVDTQISRLGGPNFHEIPIIAPLAAVQNNQRDGMHRQAIHRGRVAYEPNSLGGGCPFQAGAAGFVSMLQNVSADLAKGVAQGLGMPLPAPMPRALARTPRPEVKRSASLSLLARPGDGGIRTRKVAVLVADGVDGRSVAQVQGALRAAGAVPRLVGVRIGPFRTSTGDEMQADASMENEPAVLFDALVLPDGAAGVRALQKVGQTLEFVKDTYRHCKAILAIGESRALLQAAGTPMSLPGGEADPGIVLGHVKSISRDVQGFIKAVARHRHPERDTDPPRV